MDGKGMKKRSGSGYAEKESEKKVGAFWRRPGPRRGCSAIRGWII